MTNKDGLLHGLFSELDAESLAIVCAALDVAAGRIVSNKQAGIVDNINDIVFGIGARKYGEDEFNFLYRQAGEVKVQQ